MTIWNKRPIEVINLLNPAFCGEIIRRSITEYQKTSSRLFPYPLTFLILPIILHQATRQKIASQRKKLMHVWLETNPEIKIGFADRTTEFVSITKEAILFLLQVEAISLNEGAELQTTLRKKVTNLEYITEEVSDCYRQAEHVGKWFAHAGTPTTVYAMWGVKP